jgi:hypothetical protein
MLIIKYKEKKKKKEKQKIKKIKKEKKMKMKMKEQSLYGKYILKNLEKYANLKNNTKKRNEKIKGEIHSSIRYFAHYHF